jgi:hypothetical protein
MRYPKSIADEIESIESVVSTWPGDIEVTVEDVLKWVLQFDDADVGLAMRVIRNLNVVGQRDIDRGLQIAFSKLVRKAVEKGSRITGINTLYAAIGDVGKSGAMIGYHLRRNASISEENFLNEDTFAHVVEGHVENIVLLDDVIGTGKQATEAIEELTEAVLPLGVKNIFVLSVCGMRGAIEEIEEKTKAYTFSAFEYEGIDTAASLDSAFYDGVAHEERDRLRQRLTDYGRISYAKNPLGFGGLGGLLVLPYNTPNFTLPIIWSDANQWIPLFRRVRRVNGIQAYYKQFKKAVKDKAVVPDSVPLPDSRPAITLFVEGKRDEVFFDEVVSSGALRGFESAGSVSVVSMGSNVAPDRLVELLVDRNPNSVFIVDSDRHGAGRAHDRLRGLAPVVLLEPSYFRFFDLDRVVRDFGIDIPTGVVRNSPREELALMVERALMRSGTMDRSLKITMELARHYLDPAELEAFAIRLSEALSRAAAGEPTGSPR